MLDIVKKINTTSNLHATLTIGLPNATGKSYRDAAYSYIPPRQQHIHSLPAEQIGERQSWTDRQYVDHTISASALVY